MKPTVLTLGTLDGASTIAALATQCQLENIAVPDITTALTTLSTSRIELIFAESSLLPKLMTEMSAAKQSVPVVACGAAQPVQQAVKAIRLGAIEYLSVPLEKSLVQPLIEQFKPAAEGSFTPIHGDEKTVSLLSQAKQFAASTASVLLRGESGTGKEVYSQYIHSQSPRKNAPFVAVNCAAIPENLLESELFGHEKGAFSGATAKRLGKFQQADGGTLLLDEISEMDLPLQSKLLRAIQERVIDPVGSTKPVPVDIRLIATTNRQLEDYVTEGKFREDLYFRLNVVMLEIPSLRNRTGDIYPLAQYFSQKYGAQNNLENITISDAARTKLETCYWKGNVRELENTLHRAVLMMGTDTTMQPEHIVISPMSLKMMGMEENNQQAQQSVQPNSMSAAARQYAAAGGNFEGGMANIPPAPMVGKSLQEMEKDLILSTLTYCQGNRSHAADILGISIRTLRNKLKEYDGAA